MRRGSGGDIARVSDAAVTADVTAAMAASTPVWNTPTALLLQNTDARASGHSTQEANHAHMPGPRTPVSARMTTGPETLRPGHRCIAVMVLWLRANGGSHRRARSARDRSVAMA
ncbi:Uncharacterised protein [Clostridium paraputrificum]|nr:Uncharacterised protein [Clostridium paraputrificum]